mgnify:CR=1 FL=1
MQDDLQTEMGAAPALAPREYFEALLKYWWLIGALVAASLGGGVHYARQQPPVYRATATIVIDAVRATILSDVAPVVDTGGQSLWAQREYMETQLRILTSSAVAEQVATELGLAQDAEFLGLSAIADPAELEARLATVNPGRAVAAALTIEPVRESRAVSISASAHSAALAAELANKTAEVYIERNMQRQLESTQGASRWLDEQYEGLAVALRNSEQALVDFRRERGLIAVELEQHLSLSSRMGATSSQLAAARLEADQSRAVSQQIEEAIAAGTDVTELPVLADNALIQTLKTELFNVQSERIALSSRYLDQHPLMQSVLEREALAAERLQRETANVVASYRQRTERTALLVRQLQQRLAEVEGEVQRLGTHQVEYAALVREAEANRTLFDIIERRRKEVELSLNSLKNNVELLESATVPAVPIAPNKQLIVAAAGAGGLVLGLLLALGLAMADDTVRNQSVLERKFGLTFLGLHPKIRPTWQARTSRRGPARGQKWSPDTYVNDFPRSPVAEACRSIRTNLSFLGSESPLRTMLFTSAGPRDGKTTTSMSLATVMAQGGGRVVIVDGDMRKPRLHGILSNGQNERGLSDLLTGSAAIDACVVETMIPNLDFIPSGPIPPNPAELLGSEAFRTLLADLSRRYDRVIVDSPPVNPVTDAAIVSSAVDGVVLVVRAGTTKLAMVTHAVDALQAVDANLVGVVLNDVDLTKRKQGYYYYRQYAEYYGEREDERDAA